MECPWRCVPKEDMLHPISTQFGNENCSKLHQVLADFPSLGSIESDQAFRAAMNAAPEFLRNQVVALVEATGAHPAMAASMLLSGMAAGVHGRYYVQGLNGQTEPLGLIMMIVAERTTGKTSVFQRAYAPHIDEMMERYKSAKSIRAKRRSPTQLDEGSTAGTEPAARRFRETLVQDVTKRSLLEALEGIGEAVSIAGHDGETVLKTPLFRQSLATLNELFDGHGATALRRSGGDTVYCMDGTANVLIAGQPDAFREFHARHDGHSRSIGFDARCLYTLIPPMKVKPMLAPPQLGHYLEPYIAQVRAHLTVRHMQLERGETAREILAFSAEAERSLRWYILDHDRRSDFEYQHVQDAATRMPQHAVRIGAIIHAYSGCDGQISAQIANAGWMFAVWYLKEFSLAFPPRAILSNARPRLSEQEKRMMRETDDCAVVLDCITTICRQLEIESAPAERVRARCSLYNARFRAALLRLIDEGRVLEERVRKKLHLRVVPAPHPAYPHPLSNETQL
jgi:hypothetical protein